MKQRNCRIESLKNTGLVKICHVQHTDESLSLTHTSKREGHKALYLTTITLAQTCWIHNEA
jgi:hypothetical protein